MIVLQSKVTMHKQKMEELEKELYEKMGDDVVILPSGIELANVPETMQYLGIDVAKQEVKQEAKQQYKFMTKKDYIEQRIQIAKDMAEAQWDKISKGHNYILTTVKDSSTHYYSLDHFHTTVNPKIAIGAVSCK